MAKMAFITGKTDIGGCYYIWESGLTNTEPRMRPGIVIQIQNILENHSFLSGSRQGTKRNPCSYRQATSKEKKKA